MVSDLSGKPIIELAAAVPDRIAVISEEGSITRSELDAESNLWAGELVHFGVHAGNYVCLVLPNCVDARVCAGRSLESWCGPGAAQ